LKIIFIDQSMDDVLSVNVISSRDLKTHVSGGMSKLVVDGMSPSAPPLTMAAIQIMSNRQKNFDAKNDPVVERKSERRVSSRMPVMENGELKQLTTKLEFVDLQGETTPRSSRRTPETKIVSDPLVHLTQQAFGSTMTTLIANPSSVNPPIEPIIPATSGTTKPMNSSRRPADSPVAKPPSDRRSREPTIPLTTKSPGSSGSRADDKSSNHRSGDKPKFDRPAGDTHYASYSVVGNNTSPRLSTRRYHASSGDDEDDDHEKLNTSPPRSKEKSSAKRSKSRERVDFTPRPKSPHRAPTKDGPVIRVGGKTVTSGDMRNIDKPLNTDSYSSSNSISSRSDSASASRRNLMEQSEAIEKVLKRHPKSGSSLSDDDTAIKMAMQAAIAANQARSVDDAIANGEDLNAEVLRSLTRPNSVNEVIEYMVSQRRDTIQEQKSSRRKQLKNAISGAGAPPSDRTSNPNPRTGNGRKVIDKKKRVEEAKRSKDRHRQAAIVQQQLSDAEEDEEPLIETIDEPTSYRINAENMKPIIDLTDPKVIDETDRKGTPTSAARVNVDYGIVKKPPVTAAARNKKAVKSLPKLEPPTTVVDGADSGQIIEEEIPVKAEMSKTTKQKAIDKKAVKKAKIALLLSQLQSDDDDEANADDDDGDEIDKKTKLPPENRRMKKSDYLDNPDELGQRDYVYDPLNIGDEFKPDTDTESDNVYEESSEDEAKLTIREKKDEMLYRFRLIKEAYPKISLPKIDKKMKLAKMVRLYENVMSRIKLKVKTNNLMIFLVVGFLLMQFLAKKLGIDSAGFAVNQMYSMKRYERMLREFGESDWSGVGSELPVMIRLPIFMVINFGIFTIAKFAFKKTGKDYTAQFHKLYAQLTGGDDYSYIKDEGGDAGLGAGTEGEEEGGGGIFGMLKGLMGMFGGGMGGGDSKDEDVPKRGQTKGPKLKRQRPPPKGT